MKHTFTVDASHNQESGKIGIGILIQETTAIARRKRGQIIDTLFESFTPDEIYHGDMELYAIYRSFQIAIDRGYRHIHVRTDYNWNKRRINKALKAGSQSDDSSLFQKTLTLTLARAIEQVKVSYLPRRKNQIAHQLARKGAGSLPNLKRDMIKLISMNLATINIMLMKTWISSKISWA